MRNISIVPFALLNLFFVVSLALDRKAVALQRNSHLENHSGITLHMHLTHKNSITHTWQR